MYAVSTKKQKMRISQIIFETVRTRLHGRFLEKMGSTGLWHEVDTRRALEKTAQALRDGAAAIRKKLGLLANKALLLDTPGNLLPDRDVGISSHDQKPTSMLPSKSTESREHRRSATLPASDALSMANTVDGSAFIDVDLRATSTCSRDPTSWNFMPSINHLNNDMSSASSMAFSQYSLGVTMGAQTPVPSHQKTLNDVSVRIDPSPTPTQMTVAHDPNPIATNTLSSTLTGHQDERAATPQHANEQGGSDPYYNSLLPWKPSDRDLQMSMMAMDAPSLEALMSILDVNSIAT